MRIGIDLDDTIFNTKEQYKKYQSKYLNEKQITEKELWSIRKNRFDFIKSNFDNIFNSLTVKPYVKRTLKLLKKYNHEIYIITARSKKYNKNIYNITKDSLIKNNIPFDKLILTDKTKINACMQNKIDIIIDNSIEVYNELKNKNIKLILYDELNIFLNVKERVSKWKEILEMVKEGKI